MFTFTLHLSANLDANLGAYLVAILYVCAVSAWGLTIDFMQISK